MLERWLAVAGKGRTAPSLTLSGSAAAEGATMEAFAQAAWVCPPRGWGQQGCLLTAHPTPTPMHRAPLCQPGHVTGV